MSVLSGLGPWNWLIAAVLLFALETIVPGVFLLWFGVAAAATGLLALAIDLPLVAQLLVFVSVAVISVLAARSYLRYGSDESGTSNLNLRGQQYVGRTLVLEGPLVDGRGRARVGDSLWQVEGPDAPAGARVTVTGARGTVLLVAPAEG